MDLLGDFCDLFSVEPPQEMIDWFDSGVVEPMPMPIPDPETRIPAIVPDFWP